MRYAIWHCGRDGSNMLMSMLHQTGIAGIADYESAGFHVGFENMTLHEFKRRALAYFRSQETANGVQGCKAGFDYIDQIRKYTRPQEWEAIDWWIEGFEKHIFLSRYDKIAQAVSSLFAGHTKQWHSNSPVRQYTPPPYDVTVISHTIAELKAREYRRDQYFALMGIPYQYFFYEDIAAEPQQKIADIFAYLQIQDAYTFKAAHIQKQIDPLKKQYIQRYTDYYQEYVTPA